MIENLNKHIEKSFERLSSDIYSIDKIWQKEDYDWPGDWEGRALLAFVCLYEVTGKKIPCMDKMLSELPMHLNSKGYMGNELNGVADEQQLSGHSWLLRGLCEYYNVFKNETVLKFATKIIENLYLPLIELYEKYPTERKDDLIGGVSGNVCADINEWKLSSDIGCAYMCLDGLSAYYEITRNKNVQTAFNRLMDGFMRLDRLKMKCQTHATLSAARGILRMYKATEEQKYLCLARDVFDFYVEHGMTLTYENFNWFGKEDSWTEPCAIVDSFILSAQMFEITGNEKYQTLASRIWFNGLTFCHRANGGAGPNSCVTLKQPYLTVSMYEAPFCCSMRYCEGLKFAKKYEDIITTDEKIVKDKYGRVFKGNKILVIDEDNRFPQVRHIKFEDIDYIEIPSFSENGDYKLKVI